MKTWGHQDLIAATNADWTERLTLGVEDVPLTLEGSSLAMMLRRRPGSVDPTLILATGNGLTLIDPVARTVDVLVEAEQMSLLGPGSYVYDVLVLLGDVTTRALEGTLTVTRGITRP